MSILSAYKKLKSASKKQYKYIANSELFLCTISYDLMDKGKISNEEYGKIIADIHKHLRFVNGDANTTMYSCIDNNGVLSYRQAIEYANKYRLAWLDLMIAKYALTDNK